MPQRGTEYNYSNSNKLLTSFFGLSVPTWRLSCLGITIIVIMVIVVIAILPQNKINFVQAISTLVGHSLSHFCCTYPYCLVIPDISLLLHCNRIHYDFLQQEHDDFFTALLKYAPLYQFKTMMWSFFKDMCEKSSLIRISASFNLNPLCAFDCFFSGPPYCYF